MRLLFVADVYARAGRRAAAHHLPLLIRQRQVDFCVLNGENAAGGFGITANIAGKFKSYGADVITSGNHVWDRREFYAHLDADPAVLRPLNYPPGAPGRGHGLFTARNGLQIGVVNLQGRTHMPPIDCPFRAADTAVAELKAQTPIVFVDFHAEATAEKVAMGWHLDGRATAVVGSHTHVQTADERILPGGTAYLTDAGMTGPADSVIGTRPQIAVGRFISQLPARFKPAEGRPLLCGALIDFDPDTGRASAIERLQLPLDETTPDAD